MAHSLSNQNRAPDCTSRLSNASLYCTSVDISNIVRDKEKKNALFTNRLSKAADKIIYV